jgi:hypothetical protein
LCVSGPNCCRPRQSPFCAIRRCSAPAHRSAQVTREISQRARSNGPPARGDQPVLGPTRQQGSRPAPPEPPGVTCNPSLRANEIVCTITSHGPRRWPRTICGGGARSDTGSAGRQSGRLALSGSSPPG